MVDVIVEFAYDAEQPDELTIKVGDVITNVTMDAGGWWEGELNSKKGMFPDNFVKVIKKEEKEVKKEEVKKKEVQASKRQSVRDLANKIKDSVHDGPVPFRKKDPNAKKKRAKVVFAYDPENDDELKLAVGDSVDVLKQEEEGWWEGTVNGKTGMFPSNFVEIEDAESGDNAEKSEVAAEPDNQIKGKKVQGIGLGNIFGDGPIKLRSTSNKKPGDKPQEPPKTEKRTPESPVQRRAKETKPAETKPVEKALVRYSYQAENDDELSLTEGEVIVVLEKELEDSGWYRGEVNGKVGVFPDNFVELIKEEPTPDKAPRPMIPPTPQPKAPKKPPPPAQPPVPKATPKLPDKAPVSEPVKEEKPAPQQPVVPAKKPSHPPPPLSKKPISNVKEEEKPKLDFEHVEPTVDKLTHLTASRARGPVKRPPSQEEERNGDVKDSHWLKDDKPSHIHAHIPPTVAEKKEDVREHVHPKEKSHPLPTRPPEPSQASANLQSAIDELRWELLDLKNNTVSKTAFNELRSENERVKQDLDNFKTTYSRRLKDIMSEVDEEKKIRLATQVEIERIRKLVAESHV